MSKRLFVGGLPYTVTSTELEEMFAKFGKIVSAIVITDKFSGRSKGFGFVEMEVDAEADAAIKALHDTELGGRKIAVNEARPREDRPRTDYGSDSRGPRNDDRRPRSRGPRY